MSTLSENLIKKLNLAGYALPEPFKILQGYLKGEGIEPKLEKIYQEFSESLSQEEKGSIINFVLSQGGVLKENLNVENLNVRREENLKLVVEEDKFKYKY